MPAAAAAAAAVVKTTVVKTTYATDVIVLRSRSSSGRQRSDDQRPAADHPAGIANRHYLAADNFDLQIGIVSGKSRKRRQMRCAGNLQELVMGHLYLTQLT